MDGPRPRVQAAHMTWINEREILLKQRRFDQIYDNLCPVPSSVWDPSSANFGAIKSKITTWLLAAPKKGFVCCQYFTHAPKREVELRT